MELLIGFRGQFFVQIVILWYVNKLKTGEGFKPLPLLITALAVSLISTFVAGTRVRQTAELAGPIAFLEGQGISINVTEVAVQNRDLFVRKRTGYLVGNLKSMYSPSEDNLAADVSLYLNPSTYAEGYGTGSSYLAEAYVFGGGLCVTVTSLLIGIMLSWLHNLSNTWTGAVMLVASLAPTIYMPRGGLMDPLTGTIKELLSIGIAFILAALLQFVYLFLFRVVRSHER
jgi:hypothetical protein